jgi:hypothetical protein
MKHLTSDASKQAANPDRRTANPRSLSTFTFSFHSTFATYLQSKLPQFLENNHHFTTFTRPCGSSVKFLRIREVFSPSRFPAAAPFGHGAGFP